MTRTKADEVIEEVLPDLYVSQSFTDVLPHFLSRFSEFSASSKRACKKTNRVMSTVEAIW